MSGGRRRRNGKKTMKGGNMYGVGGVITPGAVEYRSITNIGATSEAGIPKSDISGGARRRTQRKTKMTAKAMKRILKKNGMKVSGKKSTLTKRMKKARLMKGGASQVIPMGGVAGFTGKGAEAGIGGYQDVSGGKPGDVVPLPV